MDLFTLNTSRWTPKLSPAFFYPPIRSPIHIFEKSAHLRLRNQPTLGMDKFLEPARRPE